MLFAVYRFLRLNGCRWLFPGVDGEHIPRKAIEPQKYHKLADHWYRGHTTEGSPSIEQVLDYIDFHAKQEENFYAPLGIHGYHNSYYTHMLNEANRDPGLSYISRRIYEDVRAQKFIDSKGILEDGSNKSYFPHGFHDHIYAETLVNRDCDYEAEKADYMEHLYGEDWKQVNAYLTGISEAFGEKYMNGEDSADPAKGTHYNPSRVPYLAKVKELAAMARDLAAKHLVMPTRPQTVRRVLRAGRRGVYRKVSG